VNPNEIAEGYDEGRILTEGIELAKRCASAVLMGQHDEMYYMLDEVEDPEVLHTAFIYAVTQWSHAMDVFLEEGQWAQWLINKEMSSYDSGE
jgi:hypothetical protein